MFLSDLTMIDQGSEGGAGQIFGGFGIDDQAGSHAEFFSTIKKSRNGKK